MKDPDGVYDSVMEAAKESVQEAQGLEDSEKEELVESRKDGLLDKIKKWFAYGEYVTIEIDTTKVTATVCEN